ncbi:hypothetical protein BpHYR1_016392 [Brachionus plicatilis]|uniref:Uncharacterized protein n=1 Tax=Brachionus plicatilis TaxID=10195 RepID=A0A3M7SX37_BRAPC|nr:hypothetical protein BpHYR1_016392 [Brachionus plicatilis]
MQILLFPSCLLISSFKMHRTNANLNKIPNGELISIGLRLIKFLVPEKIKISGEEILVESKELAIMEPLNSLIEPMAKSKSGEKTFAYFYSRNMNCFSLFQNLNYLN